MRGVWIGGVGLVLAFTALPALLSPRAVTLAQVGAYPGPVPICDNCGEDSGFASFVSCNLAGDGGAGQVIVQYVDEQGQPVGNQSLEIADRGCERFVPDVGQVVTATGGFRGAAYFSADPGIHSVKIQSTSADGTGPGSASPFSLPPGVQPMYTGPAAAINTTATETLPVDRRIDVCNPGPLPMQYDIFLVDDDGNQTFDFRSLFLEYGACGGVDPQALGGPGLWGGKTYSTGSQTANTYEWVSLGTGDVPDLVPGQGPGSSGTFLCGPAMAATGTVAIQNVGSSHTSVVTTEYTSEGDRMGVSSRGLDPLATFQYTVGRDRSACFQSFDAALSATALYRTDGRAPEAPLPAKASGTYFDAFRIPADPVTKRAVAFGAVRHERRTRVNVLMHNLTDRRTKARVIVRDGDGNRVFARTVRAAGHGTGRRKYLPRARGDDLWAEVKVRGGGKRVLVWLERIDPSGDVTLYPAVKLR